MFMLPADPSFPTISPQRPSMTSDFPSNPCNCPAKVSVERLNALMVPSPKFPTRRSPANLPKELGAMASPQAR